MRKDPCSFFKKKMKNFFIAIYPYSPLYLKLEYLVMETIY